MKNAKVGILMGSDSDLPVMRKAAEVFKEMGVACSILSIKYPELADRLEEFRRGTREALLAKSAELQQQLGTES